RRRRAPKRPLLRGQGDSRRWRRGLPLPTPHDPSPSPAGRRLPGQLSCLGEGSGGYLAVGKCCHMGGDDDAVIGELAENDHCFWLPRSRSAKFGLIWYVIDVASHGPVKAKVLICRNSTPEGSAGSRRRDLLRDPVPTVLRP